jgi:hypothetical protein
VSQLVIPSGTSNGRKPTLTEYVETYLNRMRAPLKESTMFTRAGRTVIHSPGERIIYGPKGQKIRILELDNGNLIQHGNERGHGVEHQHAHVRPKCVTNKLGALGVDPDAVIRQQEQRARSSRSIIIPRRSIR